MARIVIATRKRQALAVSLPLNIRLLRKAVTMGERIDVNKDYSPDNCTWITLSEQCLNKQDTIWINYNGERKQLKVWCDELKLNYKKVAQRIKQMGWSAKRAFETP